MAKRIFQAVVLFFAIYAFAFVPLGKKTGLDHVRAIIGTPAAKEAASEVKGGVTRLVRRLKSDARQSTEEADEEALDSELGSNEPPAEQRLAPKAPGAEKARRKEPTQQRTYGTSPPRLLSGPKALQQSSLDELDHAPAAPAASRSTLSR